MSENVFGQDDVGDICDIRTALLATPKTDFAMFRFQIDLGILDVYTHIYTRYICGTVYIYTRALVAVVARARTATPPHRSRVRKRSPPRSASGTALVIVGESAGRVARRLVLA